MIQVMTQRMGQAIGDDGLPGVRLIQQVVGLATTISGGRVDPRAACASDVR